MIGEARVDAVAERGDIEEPDAPRGQLDRERNAVETLQERRERAEVMRGEHLATLLDAAFEERAGVGFGQRSHVDHERPDEPRSALRRAQPFRARSHADQHVVDRAHDGERGLARVEHQQHVSARIERGPEERVARQQLR